jgi:hypothetical protein
VVRAQPADRQQRPIPPVTSRYARALAHHPRRAV